jgi:hypothetical protein
MGYRGKVEAQNRARDLRALGWTYGEIAAEVGVSKSSVSLWCRDVPIDEAAWTARAGTNRRSGGRNRRPNRLQLAKADEIRRERERGAIRIGVLDDRDLLIAGTALYAGEGSKVDGNGVRFANSDPQMIALHMRWLRRFFDIDEGRLRLKLYLHQGLDIDVANAFWSDLTQIPVSQFNRPYRAVPDPTIRRSKHPLGCPSVIYTCSRTHRRVMGLVAALLHSAVPLPR